LAMLSLPWRRWLHRGRTLQPARKSRLRRTPGLLSLERLEDRCLLAASATSLGGYGQLPLTFEANQGQTDAQVDFVARGPGYGLFLTPTGAGLSLQQVEADPGAKDSLHVTAADVVQLNLVGGNAAATATGVDLQAFAT